MRKICELTLEQIGDNLCLIVKTSESRFRGTVGIVDTGAIRTLGERAIALAEAYERRHGSGYRETFYEI